MHTVIDYDYHMVISDLILNKKLNSLVNNTSLYRDLSVHPSNVFIIDAQKNPTEST